MIKFLEMNLQVFQSTTLLYLQNILKGY